MIQFSAMVRYHLCLQRILVGQLCFEQALALEQSGQEV